MYTILYEYESGKTALCVVTTINKKHDNIILGE